jgi:hypothetical protein
MLVDRVDYLNLLEKLEMLAHDNDLLSKENQILFEEL